MEFITIGFIVILNIVAIFIFYKSLGKMEIKNKLAITLLGWILMYIILYILYGISSNGVEEIVAKASKQLLIFAFLPINIVCTGVPMMIQFRKLKGKEIKNEQFKNKMIILGIIAIIILIIECIYIKDIQKGIEQFKTININA